MKGKNQMTTEEFLQQIERADRTIDNKLSEIYRLRCLATSITVPTDREAVQTSGVSDKVGQTVAKIVDLENEIDSLIDDYIDIRQQCIKVIEMLPDPLQYTVIHKHYVQYKTFVEIAEEENYTYQWILKVHNRAIKEISKILKKKPQNLGRVYESLY